MSWYRPTETARKLVGHSGTEARCSDARCSRRRRHGSRGSSTIHRSRYSGPKDLKCERDRGRRKAVLADPEFLDLEFPTGMVDPVSRQDPAIPGLVTQAEWLDLVTPGPVLTAVCLRNVAARKAWLGNHPHVGVQMG